MTRVLVVEDDPKLVEAVKRALEGYGHEVSVAARAMPQDFAALQVIDARIRLIGRRLQERRRRLASVLSILLSLSVAALPFSARAQDAGQQASPSTAPATPPPGRAVELAPGDPAPYQGTLADRERMGAILAKRIAAEMERDAQRLLAQDAAAKQAAAEAERDAAKAARGPSWSVLIGVTGGALVLGLVGGVVAALAIQDRAR